MKFIIHGIAILLFKIFGIHFYVYCGHVPDDMRYTCIMDGTESEKYPDEVRLFLDGGMRINSDWFVFEWMRLSPKNPRRKFFNNN